MTTTAILLAAGKSSRMQGSVDDKVLTLINSKPVIYYSIKAFEQSHVVDQIIIVYRNKTQLKKINSIIKHNRFENLVIQTIQGGSRRQVSVLRALDRIKDSCNYVFIHDCARPCIRSESIKELDVIVKKDGAACLAHPVVDSIKQIKSSGKLRKQALQDLDRSYLWAMQTPQAFKCKIILEAYENIIKKKLIITDDTAACTSIGVKISIVQNSLPNPKLTSHSDLAYIKYLLKEKSETVHHGD